MTACFVAHSHRLSTLSLSGIVPKKKAFKFKIAPHKQKSIVKKKKIVKKMPPLPGQGGPVLKHNGKSGTGADYLAELQ
jgi:hypothetical protein